MLLSRHVHIFVCGSHWYETVHFLVEHVEVIVVQWPTWAHEYMDICFNVNGHRTCVYIYERLTKRGQQVN